MDSFHFNICVAMDNQRGFAKNNKLPWDKPIRKDLEFFVPLAYGPAPQGKKIVHIKGRKSWESSSDERKASPNVLHIVVSRTMMVCPAHAHKLTSGLDEALAEAKTLWAEGSVYSVLVMGGEDIYKESLVSPYCHRIYMTQVHENYNSDRFFPELQQYKCFQQVIDPNINSDVQTDVSGVNLQILVYQKTL